MISLFGQATERLCSKLDTAACDGKDVERESLFSHLTLDIIGKAVFNYEFDSLINDTGIVEDVYTVLREAEDRSVAPIPVWDIPIWKDISPRQRKVSAALKLINDVLDDLIAICKDDAKETGVSLAFTVIALDVGADYELKAQLGNTCKSVRIGKIHKRCGEDDALWNASF